MRRHTGRVVSRVAILLAGDFAALLAARAVLRAALSQPSVARAIPWDATAVGPLAQPGMPGSIVFAPALILALLATGAYSRHRGLNPTIRLGVAAALAAAATTIPLAAVVGVSHAIVQSAVLGAVAWLALMVARTISEPVLRYVWPRGRGTAPAVVVGGADSLYSRQVAAIEAAGGDYTIVRRIIADGAMPGVQPVSLALHLDAVIRAEKAEALVVADELDTAAIAAVLDTARESGCQVLYPARAVKLEGVHPRLVWHHDQPFFELGAPVLKASALLTKRVVDVVGAVVFGILAAPVMVVIALAIRLDSPGPALFAQERAGLGGRRFRMQKFRTMRVGADGEKHELAHLNRTRDARLFKIPADPRVTRLGRFLRRWSLDELPQLWNVLVGDMSLVGPRPFFESDFAAYERHHFHRLDTKPGITGLWQVSGRSEVLDFEDVIYLDRQYIEHWSFWMDVSILFRTVPAVLRRTGAY